MSLETEIKQDTYKQVCDTALALISQLRAENKLSFAQAYTALRMASDLLRVVSTGVTPAMFAQANRYSESVADHYQGLKGIGRVSTDTWAAPTQSAPEPALPPMLDPVLEITQVAQLTHMGMEIIYALRENEGAKLDHMFAIGCIIKRLTRQIAGRHSEIHEVFDQIETQIAGTDFNLVDVGTIARA